MTALQQQCLLRYLGYDTGGIDGIFGKRSTAAAAAFRDDYGVEAKAEALLQAVTGEIQPKDIWEDIRYFSKEEFRCNCGGRFCNGFPAEPSGKLVKLADKVRAHFGAAAIVSSGVRCKQHNANVGGVANSRHLCGTAMDFRVVGKTAEQVLSFVNAQPEVNYAYDIDGTYLHMDVVEA